MCQGTVHFLSQLSDIIINYKLQNIAWLPFNKEQERCHFFVWHGYAIFFDIPLKYWWVIGFEDILSKTNERQFSVNSTFMSILEDFLPWP